MGEPYILNGDQSDDWREMAYSSWADVEITEADSGAYIELVGERVCLCANPNEDRLREIRDELNGILDDPDQGDS